MKKTKSVLCVAILSIILVGNVFAGENGNNDIFSFLGRIANVVWTLVGGGDCKPRECQDCKPDERDGEGHCRPKEV